MIGADPESRRSFILAHTRLQPPPHTPELALHLADEITPIWRMTEEALEEIGLPPPFWAFAWAGGQALARYILDAPETVAGLRVVDFARGRASSPSPPHGPGPGMSWRRISTASAAPPWP
jgi:predicted nicotinamide N-methyase